MRKSIIEQLKKVTACEIDFNPEDKVINIKKTIKITGGALKVGSSYIIELNDSVTHPSSNSTLASNWNRGIVPEYSTYVVEIEENKAKMIKVNGVALDNVKSQFCGWLPYDSFEVIQKI